MPDDAIVFSIVIPTYARQDRLARCLEALCRLDYPSRQFEAIVIDDGGPEPLDALIARFSRILNISLHRQANAGPASARNNGARHAHGHYIAFTDDDCEPAPDWLSQLEAGFNARRDTMIGGHSINGLTDDPYATASQLLIDYIYGQCNANPADAQFVTSNNMAVPTALFARIGGFDATYPRAAGEDRELCDRWLSHGYEIVYAPEAVIHHFHALDWSGFWRQHKNYGHGAYHVRKTRADRASNRIRFERLSFYGGLLRYPFSRQEKKPAAMSALMLSVSQAATVIGFTLEAVRARPTKPNQPRS